MARVFIGYRRMDGQYAVGWIEERLSQIHGGTPVSTAFRDSDLKYGDDFPARLAREVDACDVLIAVIGPHWQGHEDGRPDRILDPADWVGREITSALNDPHKLIIPVPLTGVEPLRADDLLPEHRAFADLHALRFNDRNNLEDTAKHPSHRGRSPGLTALAVVDEMRAIAVSSRYSEHCNRPHRGRTERETVSRRPPRSTPRRSARAAGVRGRGRRHDRQRRRTLRSDAHADLQALRQP